MRWAINTKAALDGTALRNALVTEKEAFLKMAFKIDQHKDDPDVQAARTMKGIILDQSGPMSHAPETKDAFAQQIDSAINAAISLANKTLGLVNVSISGTLGGGVVVAVDPLPPPEEETTTPAAKKEPQGKSDVVEPV